MEIPEPSDEDLDRAETILGLLDHAYTALTPPYEQGAWTIFVDLIAQRVPDTHQAHEIIAMLLAQDAVDLLNEGKSPSSAWQAYYEMWGDRRS